MDPMCKHVHHNVKSFEYQVRGPIVQSAYHLAEQLRKSPEKYKFKKVHMCNIGNPQSCGQKPITFMRQMLSACLHPPLLEAAVFPADVCRRAREILVNNKGFGGYSQSQGFLCVRKTVASFLGRRDGFPSDSDNIFLCNGASEGIKHVMNMLIRDESDGIMVPIPQYPLYSAAIQLNGGTKVGYFLDEENGWSVNVEEMQRAYDEATARGVSTRAIVVINPGNPTGQVLDAKNIAKIIDFAHNKNLFLIADEVYQHNVYDPSLSFVSFRKILLSKKVDQPLLSFDSASKGLFGECGVRAGYVELLNCSSEFRDLYLKMASISLCSNIIGQIALTVMCDPPSESDESFTLFKQETTAIFESLSRRAELVSRELSQIKGVTCNSVKGAMYAFPALTLSPAIAEEARKRKCSPDEFYCLQLLEEEGICVVPGTGFCQKNGTFHMRITILPQEDEFGEILTRFKNFHLRFSERYEMKNGTQDNKVNGIQEKDVQINGSEKAV